MTLHWGGQKKKERKIEISGAGEAHLQLQHNGASCTHLCRPRDPYWRSWRGRGTHEGIAGNEILNKSWSISGYKRNIKKTLWSWGLQHLHQLNCGAFMKFDFVLGCVMMEPAFFLVLGRYKNKTTQHEEFAISSIRFIFPVLISQLR